jgi:hypothetical protein
VLDTDLKAVVAHACATEASFALSEMERLDAEMLAALIERHNVQLHRPRLRCDLLWQID